MMTEKERVLVDQKTRNNTRNRGQMEEIDKEGRKALRREKEKSFDRIAELFEVVQVK